MPAWSVRNPELDIQVFSGNLNQLLQVLEEKLKKEALVTVGTLNPEIWVAAQKSPKLREIIQNYTICISDGVGISLAYRLLNDIPVPRITGVDLMMALLEQNHHRVYLLGADPWAHQRAVRTVAQNFPGTQIVGNNHGFWEPQEEELQLRDIEAAKPDIVFVAMGTPRQEYLIEKLSARLPKGILIGVGGAFDVLSGKKMRAPKWVRKSGLEWMYRVLQDPKRLPRVIRLAEFGVRILMKKAGQLQARYKKKHKARKLAKQAK